MACVPEDSMKVDYAADHEFSPATARGATGRDIDEWFADFDTRGGPGAGRKALGDYLFKERKVDAWWTTTLLVEYEKARGVTEKDGGPRGYSICVTKSVAAPAEAVFAALLDTRWWLGSAGPAALSDGSTFDDGEGHRGLVSKLTSGKVLRFSWEGPGHQAGERVEIKLASSGAKTSVVLTHDRLPDRAAADGMRAAWARVLDGLKERVA
jgi:uncharacterized protein YndB with AHSA1/START domain